MIELFKDGDNMAIRTDCQSEDQFMNEFSHLLSGLIDEGSYQGDWEFQLSIWLPQCIEICCKYRGYKADVEERRVLVAGDRLLSAPLVHRFDPKERGVQSNGFGPMDSFMKKDFILNNLTDLIRSNPEYKTVDASVAGEIVAAIDSFYEKYPTKHTDSWQVRLELGRRVLERWVSERLFAGKDKNYVSEVIDHEREEVVSGGGKK